MKTSAARAEIATAGGESARYLEVAGVTKRFGPSVVLKDLSLAVAQAEFVSLLGPSGCGKTTLLRLVAGLLAPDAGSISIGGRELTRVAAHRRNIGVVFQNYALFPHLTVAENVAFGLELRGVPTAERQRIVQEKLELVHLEAWAQKHAHELSGGMQQRVGLARAFATDADILLMDEPFSALDPLIRDRLQDELLELQGRLHKTIVFVSHDLDEALKLGSHIAIMEGGRIIQVGTPETIVTRPANEYVRSFVANVNPLNVLRLGSLMCPCDRLEAENGWLWLDRRISLRVQLDGDGRPLRLTCADRDLGLIDGIDGLADLGATSENLVRAAPGAPIRLAIEGIRRSGWPVAVAEPDGRLLGVVRIDEILHALRRRPR